MGFYINLENTGDYPGKITSLRGFGPLFGELITEGKDVISKDILESISADKVLIVWGRPSFEVLIIIPNEAEFDNFNIDDGIYKEWYSVKKSTAMEWCSEYNKLMMEQPEKPIGEFSKTIEDLVLDHLLNNEVYTGKLIFNLGTLDEDHGILVIADKGRWQLWADLSKHIKTVTSKDVKVTFVNRSKLPKVDAVNIKQIIVDYSAINNKKLITKVKGFMDLKFIYNSKGDVLLER